MQFMLLFSRQGKLRLQKWYVPLSDKEKKKITRELVQTVLARKPKMCSFLEWRDLKIVYKRYASLYFCCAIEDQDNELITLEIIHRYVELLDKYFGSVCELDIIFNFEKAYFILDEFLLGGEVQETSKKNVLKAIEQADLLQEGAHSAGPSVHEGLGCPQWATEVSLKLQRFPSRNIAVIASYLSYCCLPFNLVGSPLQCEFITSLGAGGVYMFCKLKSHQERNKHFSSYCCLTIYLALSVDKKFLLR
ncbi:AP-1 complex subunit sigma-2 isoform X1 [Chroicocephalus ridibundus]|uniref:AP-1 complex subunit sigma-2 isoform X1 n=1 Tax=Chroicocephalus ridibundus TaxID=1192867 RepID=UPI002FDCDE0E